MNRNMLAVVVAIGPLLACAPKPPVDPKPTSAEALPTVVVASSATASSVTMPVATAPAVDAAPSVSAPPSIRVAALDAAPPEDPGPVVLTVQEWVLSSSTHLTIAITAKGYALFDMTYGEKHRGKVTSEGLEAFRVALVKARAVPRPRRPLLNVESATQGFFPAQRSPRRAPTISRATASQASP